MADIKLYGLRISYYTGKMEGYLRCKEIPHEFIVLNRGRMGQLKEKTGAAQMPAVELPDGRFMADTTPMFSWFEEHYTDPPVIPADPILRFISYLVEDYAEEWLWRPAMHYRWTYKTDRLPLGRKIVDELMADEPLPNFLKRAFIRRRQHREYVQRDGVDVGTWDHVESIYLKTLDRLADIGSGYLPYLNANALAWQQGLERFDPIIQGVQYHSVPVSQYRVWCLEQLQKRAREVHYHNRRN